MYKVTGICMVNGNPTPRTVYCVSFGDILYACVGAGIELNDHYIKIEYIEFDDEEEKE